MRETETFLNGSISKSLMKILQFLEHLPINLSLALSSYKLKIIVNLLSLNNELMSSPHKKNYQFLRIMKMKFSMNPSLSKSFNNQNKINTIFKKSKAKLMCPLNYNYLC
jgi:hypothetical protein